jgi:charged multivesicular body protein 2A
MTPAERLRKHQRALEKTQRELDRERVKLENQEKKLVQDIKKSAKNGQMGAVKIQAKDLVRTRRYVRTRGVPWRLLTGNSRYITKFHSMRTQLQAISLRIQVGSRRLFHSPLRPLSSHILRPSEVTSK